MFSSLCSTDLMKWNVAYESDQRSLKLFYFWSFHNQIFISALVDALKPVNPVHLFEDCCLNWQSNPKFRADWIIDVDDTFFTLDQDRVDFFLHWHLNSQQPSIRFTMEMENDSKIRFLARLLIENQKGLL